MTYPTLNQRLQSGLPVSLAVAFIFAKKTLVLHSLRRFGSLTCPLLSDSLPVSGQTPCAPRSLITLCPFCMAYSWLPVTDWLPKFWSDLNSFPHSLAGQRPHRYYTQYLRGIQVFSVYRFWECVDFGSDDFPIAAQDGQLSHLNQPGFHPTLICKRYNVGIPTELANYGRRSRNQICGRHRGIHRAS